jgi:hypothetical protein
MPPPRAHAAACGSADIASAPAPIAISPLRTECTMGQGAERPCPIATAVKNHIANHVVLRVHASMPSVEGANGVCSQILKIARMRRRE